jgi:hypothetical protein
VVEDVVYSRHWHRTRPSTCLRIGIAYWHGEFGCKFIAKSAKSRINVDNTLGVRVSVPLEPSEAPVLVVEVCEAKHQNVAFDPKPVFEEKQLASKLANHGIAVKYYPCGSI